MTPSVVILTFNEEPNIERCLSSLGDLDDVLLIDSGSTDRTVEIAEGMGARVLRRAFDDFAGQRNFALESGALRHDWVLHLDADEELTDAFRAALRDLRGEDTLDGYRVPSKTMLNGAWLRHAGMYPTYQVRIGHRDRLRFKQVGHGQREASPPERIGTFDVPYLHHNFSHGLAAWFAKHVRYASDEADQALRERAEAGDAAATTGDRTEGRRSLKRLANRLPGFVRPLARFAYVYFVRRGILDGRAGFLYASMLAIYEGMIAVLIAERSSRNAR